MRVQFGKEIIPNHIKWWSWLNQWLTIYRGITLSPTILKLFGNCIQERNDALVLSFDLVLILK